jgi:hypothetical protein
MARPRIRLLIPNDPHPMRIERDLAKEIGLNESIVLLQLEYLITISNNERDGRLWTYQSLTDLHEIYFPWWSATTISRIVKSLEEKQLIIIGNFNKLGYDRTQWYALNEMGISKLTSVLMHSDAILQNEKWNYQNEKSILQNGDIDHAKMKNGSSQNETTIPEITQRVPKESGAAAPKAAKPLDDLSRALFDLCLLEPDSASKADITAMRKTYRALVDKCTTVDQVRVQFSNYWYSDSNWRTRKAHEGGYTPEPPKPDQVLTEWPKAMAWKPTKKSSTGGIPQSTRVAAPADAMPAQETARRMKELIAQQRGEK